MYVCMYVRMCMCVCVCVYMYVCMYAYSIHRATMKLNQPLTKDQKNALIQMKQKVIVIQHAYTHTHTYIHTYMLTYIYINNI